jgi:erythromycin esterase
VDNPADLPGGLVASLREHAIPLAAVEPGYGFSDLHWLKALVGDARVVALGEATHGTREFFRCRHRMVEFLVSEMGFTTVAIEAPWPESRAVDDYVLHGTGDPAAALAEMYFWTCNTEEVVDLVEWMWRYNAAPSHQRKLRFAGIDTQFTAGATADLVRYLEIVDPAYAAELGPRLTPLRAVYLVYQSLPVPTADALSAAVSEVNARLQANGSAYVARSSASAWRQACRCARVLSLADGQRRAGADNPSRFTLRDRSMAESIGWLLDEGGPRSRVVVWAHNGHVARDATGLFDGEGVETTGMNLPRRADPGAVVIGFAFGSGAFQAMVEERPGVYDLRDVVVGPPPAGSLDAALAEVGLPAFALDLRRMEGDVAAWFHAPRITREVGALYESEAAMLRSVVPAASYDALIFLDRTTRARPTATARRHVELDDSR